MRPEQLFPIVMVAMSAVSAVIYAAAGDWWRALYWVSAMGITTSAIYMK